MARTPPWKRANPTQRPTTLTAASKASARARAQRAGRAYPNLVDNMWAAKQQRARGPTTATTATTATPTRKPATRKPAQAKRKPAGR